MSRSFIAPLWMFSLVMISSGGCAGPRSAEPTGIVSVPATLESPDLVRRYQETITADELASHLYFFASDFFEGRETTTRGQKMAAYYLAAQYRKMGLKPSGTTQTIDPLAPDAYFQPFDVSGIALTESSLKIIDGRKTTAIARCSDASGNADFLLASGGSGETTAPVVFGGYGIADDDLNYNDFAALDAQGIDISGKWLMLLPNEPLANDSTSLLPTEDRKPSRRWTYSSMKLEAARSHNPAGYLIVYDAGSAIAGSWTDNAVRLAHRASGVGRLSLSEPAQVSVSPGLPVYLISSDLADRILASSEQTVTGLMSHISTNLEPFVFELDGVSVQSSIDRSVQKFQTENVLAVVEGSDPALRDEVVIISSHYDHIGINEGLEGDRINNGADDDGSGTVATLEMAEAFMKAKSDGHGPRRSILFLNVSGEEKGLLGSAYYADVEPVFPLEKTVANLNIDMIGRFDPSRPTPGANYVYIIGSRLISQDLHDINALANEKTGIRLELDERFNSAEDPNRFYQRSDHWNFGKHGIPFIFYFTGTHEDYHRPGDEPHKIAYDRMARITRLIFATAWQAANQDDRPAISGKGFNE